MAFRSFDAVRLGAIGLVALAVGCGESEPTTASTYPELAALVARAEGGDSNAQVELGDRFESSDSSPHDDAVALKWYRKAALQDHPEGQYSLGVMIYRGRGQSEDRIEGAKWILKSAEAGYTDAQNSLAVLYAMGGGVAQDHQISMDWFLKAAEAGHATAQMSLGARLAEGLTGPKDPEAAAEWFRRSAENGLPAAQWRYGLALAVGEGVPKDDREAYFWLLMSGVARSRDTIDLMEGIEATLTDEERAAIRVQMTEWARDRLGR